MTRSFTTSGICTPAFELTVENGILTNINIPKGSTDKFKKLLDKEFHHLLKEAL